MSDIRAGDVISTTWWPESVRVEENTDQASISSTTFVTGSPVCSTTFVAPTSGRVAVIVAAEMREDSAGDRVFVTFEMYLGTSSAGTLVQSAKEVRGVSTNGYTGVSQFMTLGNMTMIEALTGGSTYYIQAMHRVDGGALNDIGHRRLCVIPLP